METDQKQLEKELIAGILSVSLPLEYGMMDHLERLLPCLPEAQRKKMMALITDTYNHAVVTRVLLEALGQPTDISFYHISDVRSAEDSLKRQLEFERLARWLHARAAENIEDDSERQQLLAMSLQEESHIQVIEAILREIPHQHP